MVIDTSAILAMLLHEPEWRAIALAIEADPVRLISAASIFEASVVASSRLGKDGLDELDLLLGKLTVEMSPFGVPDLQCAREAYFKYGKGRHPAALNFGDCFSYALATLRGEPLLFKGNYFSQTDLRRVVY